MRFVLTSSIASVSLVERTDPDAADRRSVSATGEPVDDGSVVVVRGTRKLLSRLSAAPASEADKSTTMLGDWYATVLPWRPRQVALLVSEARLLPVMMPMAPASTLLQRFPNHLAAVLRRLGVDETVTAVECAGTVDYRVATTQSRSVLGSMNEFTHLANAYRSGHPTRTCSNSPCSCRPFHAGRCSGDTSVLTENFSP
jgi:hypothetical protein